MSRFRIALLTITAVVLAAVAMLVVPRGIDAASALRDRDDPAALADAQVAAKLDAKAAERRIRDALAAKDADLAQSFLALASEHHVSVAPALAAQVEAATAEANSAAHKVESFARGFVTGVPDDLAGFAGTATGDLFVFGDVRDAVREGTKLATGAEADRLVLGLACVGLAVTAGTYATLGASAPVRVGLSLVKAARKTGRIGARMAVWLGRSLRKAVDWAKLRRALAGATLTEPAVAIRAAREAVRVEKAGGILTLVRNVGRVEAKAGTRATLDGLKLAQGPEEVARLAKLAEKKGNKTRAILELLGRGAIALTLGAFDLGLWVSGAILTLLGFAASAKGAAERWTMRRLQRRKARRLAALEQEMRNQRLALLALGRSAPGVPARLGRAA